MIIDNQQAQQFLFGLRSRLGDLESCIRYCKDFRNTEIAEINVISISFLAIFTEIAQYIEYYRVELSKVFGFSTASEWERIQEEIIRDFEKEIVNKNIDTVEKRIMLINDLILKWDSFPKENSEAILDSSTTH